LFWAPPEKPGRASVLIWAPPKNTGRAGVLFLSTAPKNGQGGRLALGVAQSPGGAGRLGVGRPVVFYFLGSIKHVFFNTLRIQDKTHKISKNPRTSARLSAVCCGYSKLRVADYKSRGFMCPWCVIWGLGVSGRTEQFVAHTQQTRAS
jgi:hypothetical protein